MLDSRVRSNSTLTKFDYGNVAKSICTTIALMALTKYAMEHSQRRLEKPIKPFYKNYGATATFTTLSCIYVAGSLKKFSPYTKANLSPESQRAVVIRRPQNGGLSSFSMRQIEEIQAKIIQSRQDIFLAIFRGEERHRQEISLLGSVFIFDINLRNPRELRGVLSVQNQALAQIQRALPQLVQNQIARPQPQENGRISFDPSVFERMDLERRLRHAVMRGPLDDYIPQKRPQELERLLQSVQEFRPSIPSNVLQSLIEPPPEMNMDDFVLVRGPTLRLPGIGVLSERLYGQNGILMRVMLFRALLNEYADLLTSMGVELSDTKGSKELESAFYFLNCPGSAPSAIEQYKQFVDAHEALILAEKSPEVSEISKKMALARMTPRIQAFQEAFVQEHVGDHDPFTLENFTETFVTRNKTIAASDPQMRVDYWTREGIKLYGAMSWAHYLKINPPQLRNQEDGVFYLRHATPNKYDPERGVIIDPLYREFLRGADGMVLYAAHQRLKDDGFPENEDVRCQTLVQCESEEENLLLIFQSVENSLFKKGAKTFAELKEKLIDSFYLEEGSRLNRLPARLQGSQISKENNCFS